MHLDVVRELLQAISGPRPKARLASTTDTNGTISTRATRLIQAPHRGWSAAPPYAAYARPGGATDAADATSSGASGNSNAIVAEMVRQNYPHSVLAPICEPQLAIKGYEAGVGAKFSASWGGALDPRYTPIEMDFEVISVSDAPFDLETWIFIQNPGRTAVLRANNYTIVATEFPVMHVDRSLFLVNGQDPANFHSTVVKSPHCEPQFYDDWVEANLNVDAPGATSANLPSLGHTICKRPMFPMEQDAVFEPSTERFSRH